MYHHQTFPIVKLSTAGWNASWSQCSFSFQLRPYMAPSEDVHCTSYQRIIFRKPCTPQELFKFVIWTPHTSRLQYFKAGLPSKMKITYASHKYTSPCVSTPASSFSSLSIHLKMQYGPVTTSLWSSTFSLLEFAVLIASLSAFVSCPIFFTVMTYNLLGWCKIIALRLGRRLGRCDRHVEVHWKGGRIDTYLYVLHQSCCSCASQLHQFSITTSYSGGTWEHAKTSP